MIKVYGYKPGSRSAKALAEQLNSKVLRHVGSKYRPRLGDVVINWGSSRIPEFAPATTLNTAEAVAVAACKYETFCALGRGEVSTPPWTVHRNKVSELLQFPVVCRTVLNGHSGEGIVIANNEDELVDAPLYTQYVKKKDEYRVHCVRCPDEDPDVTQFSAFFIQRKARKLDVEEPNWQIRNLAGGFSFVESKYEDIPGDVIGQAFRTMDALGLDFGGVDVIWNEHEQKAYVLEVNTACGLEQRTAEKYAEAIRDLIAD